MKLYFPQISQFKTPYRTISSYKPALSTDCFVRQKPSVNFCAKAEKVKSAPSLPLALNSIKMQGKPFLCSLAASMTLLKAPEGSKSIFFPKDEFKIENGSIKSHKVNIDSKKAQIKIKDANILLDSKKCDYVDFASGIFRKNDGSLDVNLSKGKYIDIQNGIIVDPNAKISVAMKDGKFTTIAIPDFKADTPMATKDVLQKIHAFATPSFKYNFIPILDDFCDIFGNKIITCENEKTGCKYLSLVPKIGQTEPFLAFKVGLGEDFVNSEISRYQLKQYIEKKYPELSKNLPNIPINREFIASTEPRCDEKFDPAIVKKVFSKLTKEDDYLPPAGSKEAIEFAKYQNILLKTEVISEPFIAPEKLLIKNGENECKIDLNDDGIPEAILTNDDIINMSYNNGDSYYEGLLIALKQLLY